VNTQGQLVGINSAIASPSGTYTGYAYAIPANIVKKVVGDLKQYGKVQRGYLGIKYLDRKQANPEEMTALGLDRNDGVYVQDVTEGGGAKAAGIRRGDFITQVGGINVHTEPELLEQIARYKPGDHIAITYKRGGTDYNTTVELKNISGNTGIVRDGSGAKLLGATVRPLTSDERRNYSAYYGISGGVMVTDPGKGALARTRPAVKKNFVITAINDQEVNTVEDLQRAMASAGFPVQLRGIYPGYNGNYYYSITEPGADSEQ
jgi:S1-C subfamily serine protease